MAHVSYIGRNGGANAELEAAKTEALQIANELARAKLDKLRGTVVERKIVEFVLGHVLATLREQILRLPMFVAADLRGSGLEHNQIHGIRMRINDAVRRSLSESAETLGKAVEADDFLVGFNGDDSVVQSAEQKDARERKRTVTNAKRREKRNAKRDD